MSRSVFLRAALAASVCLGALPASALALPGTKVSSKTLIQRVDYPQTQHLHFTYGPIQIMPGQNNIDARINQNKPTVPGYITRFAPNLVYAGTHKVPRVDVIHLHHAVWLSNGAAGKGNYGFLGFYPFMAAGEEKTISQQPPGYGYPVGKKDAWVLNYMIHNLTPDATRVYLTYDVDFIPATSAAARTIRPVYPVWMDVEAGHLYPVFDVKRRSGSKGLYTFPDQAKNAYAGRRRPANEWSVTTPGTLVSTAGHVHPGGLWTQLDLLRPGATVTAASRRAGVSAGTMPGSVRLFRSYARYWDKRGPISWDMAMTGTPSDWRVRVRPGDTLRVSATFETRRASWYESLGIMVLFMTHDSDGKGVAAGVNPFRRSPDQNGRVTHGHLAENNHHGGAQTLGANALKFPTCSRTQVGIKDFLYRPGDFKATGDNRCLPTVRQGASLTFTNFDASTAAVGNILFPGEPYLKSIFHTITSCQDPCGLDTGISYPLANGAGGYDSSQLGFGTPAADRVTWSTPSNLKPATYTYFCRIHPFMRGAFRVVRG